MASVEYQHFTITVDANVQKEIERLLNEGWTPVPGVQPVALYHMQRIVGQQQVAGVGPQVGVMLRDEGVTVIRGNGK